MSIIHGGDIYRNEVRLDFSSNTSPLGTPSSVRDAVIKGAELLGRYPDVRQEKLCREIARYEGCVSPLQVVCGNGAAELIFMLCYALRPLAALMPAPSFAEYERALKACGCRVVYSYLKEEEGFRPGEAFLHSISVQKPELVFFCNPNNPTGVIADRDYMDRLMKECEAAGSWLILDECFLDFADYPEKYTMVSVLESFDKLVIIKSFTKRYAMPGIRLGYALTHDTNTASRLRMHSQPWNVSVIAEEAGIQALSETAYVRKSRSMVIREREYLSRMLTDLGFKVWPPGANYIFFKGPENLFDLCLSRGILIRDCGNYAGLRSGFFRVAVKTHEENLQLIEALKYSLFSRRE